MAELKQFITKTLTDLAAAREQEAAYPSGCKPITLGVTHCKSCGFHYSTSVHVATWRDSCKTPAFHMPDWNDSPVCEL